MSELKEKKEVSSKKTKAKEIVSEKKKEKVAKPKKTNESKKEKVVKEVKKKEVVKKSSPTKATDKETKEIKIDNTLLDKNEQKKLKTISKIISVITKILRVCAMIVLPLLFIIMIALPIIFKNVEINGNIIKFDDMNLVLHNDTITANLGEKSYIVANNVHNLDHIISFLNDNSLSKLLLDFELSIGFLIIVVVINVFILQYIEKLFDNFYRGETPFTLENSEYIRKIGKMMIISLIVAFVFELILSITTKGVCSINIGTYGIIEILCVYVIYYIFKYGTYMQKKVNTKIYE